MDWKRAWTVKSNVWSAASPFEAIWVDGSRKRSVMVCQHSAGCSPFFFHILMEVVQTSYWWQLRFLDHRNLGESSLIWIVAHKNHSYLFLPCCTAIIALVDHLVVSASCLEEGKDDPEDGQRPKYCKKCAWVMGFTPVIVYFCFSRAGSTEFLCCL